MQYAIRSDASLRSIDPTNYISSWRHHIVRHFCWATYGDRLPATQLYEDLGPTEGYSPSYLIPN